MADITRNSPAREYRTLRPYRGVGAVQDLLDDAVLRLDGEASVVPDGNAVIEANAYLTTEVAIDLLGEAEDSGDPVHSHVEFVNRLEDALGETGIGPDEFSLLRYTFVITTPYLKLLHEAWSGSHADFTALLGLVAIAGAGRDDRPKPLLAPSGGCVIEMIVHLNQDRDGKRADHPLEVWGKGTWLGRIRFSLATDITEIGFTPTPLTADLKQKLDLPSDTVRYIVPENPLDPEGSATDLLVYVDEGVLNAITANPGGSGARTFQHQLALDVVASIIGESSRSLAGEPETTLTSIHESLCHRLIRQASRTTAGKVDEEREEAMFTRLKDEPLRVLAEFEGGLDTIRKQLLVCIREAS
ncbi:MAG: hypothetical protein H8E69_00670 [Actinobacteria bacterium]|nr:hypothetical protein [Actinomycetota bacterium]